MRIVQASRIESLRLSTFEDVTELVYLNASSRGRAETARLPITVARVGTLADELDAIIVTSDLQGMLQSELLGIRVAEVLEELALAHPDRTGVILAGDLYCIPAMNKRGGFGAVVDVWRAFAERFAWVAGVAGNHDDTQGIEKLDRCHLLDGDVVELDGLRIGGVGGIISGKQKPGRRSEDDQLALVTRVLDATPDILVLHEGPHGGDHQPGNDVLRASIDATDVPLVICGHEHWHAPLAVREPRGQILNVDTRVVVLRAR